MVEGVQERTAVAIYARVSTEDQAERATVQSQLDFLRKFTDLHGLPVAGEYVDDGVSGTLPLAKRSEGRRLLVDAEAGRFGSVLVYRLDRLGRSLSALLAANEGLTAHGVAIRSATEPFDTGTPIGSFLFQLLGSLAELEKSTISERTTLGRNRVAGHGQYTGGPIPLGYDLDDAKRFIPSERIVDELGITEAQLVRDIFTRIASGESTLNKECGRLTALGVPRRQRYGGKSAKVIERTGGWGLSTLGAVVHNPVYKGTGSLKSSYGDVERPAPELVDPKTWQAAQDALIRNRNLSAKSTKNTYLLRGLVRCSICGLGYVGMTSSGKRKYRCNSNAGRASSRPEGRCASKVIHADWLEEAVWREVREFVLDPGPALDEARRKLRERMADVTGAADRRRALLDQLATKETERERVLTMYRKGKVSDDEAERELDAIAREAGQLREMIESERAQASLLDAQEAHLSASVSMMARIRDGLADVEATNDLAAKREIIEAYVRSVTIDSRRIGDRKYEADIRLSLLLRPDPIAVEDATQSPGGKR